MWQRSLLQQTTLFFHLSHCNCKLILLCVKLLLQSFDLIWWFLLTFIGNALHHLDLRLLLISLYFQHLNLWQVLWNHLSISFVNFLNNLILLMFVQCMFIFYLLVLWYQLWYLLFFWLFNLLILQNTLILKLIDLLLHSINSSFTCHNNLIIPLAQMFQLITQT